MSKLYQFVLLKLIIFLFFGNILLASNCLKLGVVGSYNNFNPYSIIGTTPKDYYILMYDSLMFEELNDLGIFKPLIAESYEINGNEIIFNINKKSPLDSSDIIYTFETIKNYGAPYYKQKLADVIEIQKLGKWKVKFKTKNFSKSLFNLIVALPIISEEYWQNKDFLAPSLEIPKTSGAYFIDDFNQGKDIVFKKNLNYWAVDVPVRKGYFNFNKISYKYVKTSKQLSELYKRGDINFKELTTTDKVVSDDKIFIQKNNNIPTFKAYFLNNKTLNYIKVREAINYAYNFDLVKSYFLSNNQQRLQSLFENSKFKDSSFVFSNKSNLAKAKEILNGKKGIKIRFLFKSVEDFKISQDFMNNLKSLGFDVSYKIPSFYDYIELVKKRDYEIVLESLLFSRPPQDELISYFTKRGEYNYSNVDESVLVNAKKLKDLDLKLKKQYAYIPLYYDLTTEYLYKDKLEYSKQEVLDIFKWRHK